MGHSIIRDRALIWAVGPVKWPLMKIGGISVLQRILNALTVPQLEKIGLLVSAQNKAEFEPAVDHRLHLILTDELDFARAIIMAEDWFKNFSGNVLLLTADLPFVNASLVSRLLGFLHAEQAVGCLPVAHSVRAQKEHARIIRDGQDNIRRLHLFSQPFADRENPFVITGFPFLFEWDCLQRALYQVLHKRENAHLMDVIEKITDNGFEIKSLAIENDLPLFRIHNEEDMQFARKILTIRENL